MLSASYTLVDVRHRLMNVYSYYGYATDDAFIVDLKHVAEDVYRMYYLPRIGATEYDRIAAKNKVGLTTVETYLYWAEVFAICFHFLKDRTAAQSQLQTATGDETLTVEGYTYKSGGTGSGGVSSGDSSMANYYNNMYRYFKLAGYDIAAIQRTCTIFGDSESSDDILEIIE